MSVPNQAFVTLATNDNYCLGALVLGYSLRNVATTRKLVILITPSVSNDMRTALSKIFDLVQEVDVMHSKETNILQAMKRPELGVTLTKLHCWRLTQFDKCVFMDADTLPLKNIDELFEKDELSAACDIGWPDCFNTGLFVYKPSEATFNSLCQFAKDKGSFDGGDQGLLNSYFSDWATSDISKHLSFVYNMSSVAVYSYPAAYAKFGDSVKVVHFLGCLKPWMYGFNTLTRKAVTPPHAHSIQLEHVQKWWDVFIEQVKPQLTPDCAATIIPACMHDTDDFGMQLQTANEETDGKSRQRIECYFSDSDDSSIGSTSDEETKSDTEVIDKFDNIDNIDNITSPSNEDDDEDNRVVSFEYASNAKTSQINLHQDSRRKAWEKHEMDYTGVDSFDNIQKKLDQVFGINSSDDINDKKCDYNSISSSAFSQLNVTDSTTYISKVTATAIAFNPKVPSGLASQLARLRLDAPEGDYFYGALFGNVSQDDFSRRRAWEEGAIDYMGADSFANIQKKLDQAIGASAEDDESKIEAETAQSSGEASHSSKSGST